MQSRRAPRVEPSVLEEQEDQEREQRQSSEERVTSARMEVISRLGVPSQCRQN